MKLSPTKQQASEREPLPVRRASAVAPWARRVAVCTLVAAIAFVWSAGAAWGQRASDMPAQELKGIDVVEKLGDRVPQDLTFVNSKGEQVRLGDYFEADKPVVINLLYFGCPMLCHLATQGLVDVLGETEWTPGDEFTVVTVSFDPSEGPDIARKYRDASVSALGREDARDGWAFLTGEQEQITALTESLGFGYQWVEEKNEFAHAAALMVVTPDGRISRYLHGIQHDPTTFRRALVEASDGKVGTIVDQVLWRCLAYDPDAGEYVVAAWAVFRLGGVLTLVMVVGGLGWLWFLEIRRRKKTAANP